MDIRNVALSPRSAELLRQIDSWPEQAATYRKMCVWEERGTSRLTFDAASAGRSELGWLVEVTPLLARLWQRLDEHSNITLVFGSVTDVATTDQRVTLSLDQDGETTTLDTDFLIASDGAKSAVRDALQVEARRWPTGQMAVTTVVRTERAHDATAWQRFLLDGPLALLPSTDPHLCSIVWSQSERQATQCLTLSDSEFCLALTRASETCLGTILEAAPRQAFPLNQQLATAVNPHRRVLLLGDALRVVHPLAGLGVNLGFEDLHELLAIAKPNVDLCRLGLWDKFARQRLLRSEIMLRSLDGLKRLYGNPNPWVGWLRNTGVGWFGRRRWLQRKAIEEATGLRHLSG
jgi:ubiquinone biosynthesis UbiH/UbiF/VisC/COQ6 family hydroxylase